MSASLVSEHEVEPVTPADLVAAVRAQRVVADRAEARILELAVEWAHAHPAEPGERWWAPGAGVRSDGVFTDGAPDETVDLDDVEWFGIPTVACSPTPQHQPRPSRPCCTCT